MIETFCFSNKFVIKKVKSLISRFDLFSYFKYVFPPSLSLSLSLHYVFIFQTKGNNYILVFNDI